MSLGFLDICGLVFGFAVGRFLLGWLLMGFGGFSVWWCLLILVV